MLVKKIEIRSIFGDDMDKFAAYFLSHPVYFKLVLSAYVLGEWTRNRCPVGWCIADDRWPNPN